MITRNELKYIKSLQLKKFRDQEKQFVAEGRNNVEEGINSSMNCTHLLLSESYHKMNPEAVIPVKAKNIRYSILSDSDFQKVSDSVNPQGVLGVFDIPQESTPDFKNLDEPVIFLDNIADPGNVGTIMRTADWFGIKHLVLSTNSADVYNPKTVRASAGSIFHLNLCQDQDLTSLKDEIKQAGYTVVVTVLDGENLYRIKFNRKTVLVFSNEAAGITDDVLRIADSKITIPKTGEAESLNVASAAAVVMSEMVKRLEG